MPLQSGQKLSHYRLVEKIGEGGMGVVWKAVDQALDREVAIKVLPDAFAADAERLARFQREAKLLASLNHPNIAAIHGLEDAGGVQFLALELVPGDTLAERLVRGPLPVEETLRLGQQIAAALETAHENGVIHRDIKPGNIKVTPEGQVKVLDFGLAKALEKPSPGAEPSQETTLQFAGTRDNVILGTAPYMSPEQASGKPLDKRTDIWSFGCVLYELLTGRQAFDGKTVSETMARVLEREPDWDALRGRSTAGIVRLIRRCLRKDPRRRLHDIADARIELEEAQGEAAGEAGGLADRPTPRPWRARGLWALAGLLIGALVAVLGGGLRNLIPHPPSPIVRATLTLPGGLVPGYSTVPSVAVSPDGRTVVFRGGGPEGVRLYRRALGETATEPIPGTEGGFAPFFSPDGEWLAFFAATELRKIPIAGGNPIKLCFTTPKAQGGTWPPGGRIIFARSFNGPLWVIPESGGDPQPLTQLASDEHAHLYPQALPGGRLLFTAVGGRDFQDVTSARVVVLDLETGERRVVLEGATFARYGGDGWVMFVRGDSAFAAPLDLRRLQVTAAPVALPETIAVDPAWRTAHLDVSRDGTLVYVSGSAAERPATEVLSLDRHGRETPLAVPPGDYYALPSLSPDGRKLALERVEGARGTVVVFDRDRQVLSSVVPEPGRFGAPIWSPDGRRLALGSVFHGAPRLVVRTADGSGSIESPTPPTEDAEFPNSWSPDGRTIAYTVVYTADRGGSRLHGTSDIWLASSDGSSPPRPWMETPYRETSARFSPDGSFLAYVSDESGKNEVYVRPLAGQEKIQISSDGGIEPVWTGAGRELLYRRGDRFFAVGLGPGPAIRPGPARFLFGSRFDSGGGRPHLHHFWDISSDGQEIIALRTAWPPEAARELMVVTGWLASLDHARGGS